MPTSVSKGRFEIEIEGISLEETERLRLLTFTLITEGIFHLRNGNATLHFDHQGQLQAVDVNYRKWRREKRP